MTSRTYYAIVRQLGGRQLRSRSRVLAERPARRLAVLYTPVPGTVLFAGYGGSYEGPEHFRFRGMERTVDAFFVKLSYLFRM